MSSLERRLLALRRQQPERLLGSGRHTPHERAHVLGLARPLVHHAAEIPALALDAVRERTGRPLEHVEPRPAHAEHALEVGGAALGAQRVALEQWQQARRVARPARGDARVALTWRGLEARDALAARAREAEPRIERRELTEHERELRAGARRFGDAVSDDPLRESAAALRGLGRHQPYARGLDAPRTAVQRDGPPR